MVIHSPTQPDRTTTIHTLQTSDALNTGELLQVAGGQAPAAARSPRTKLATAALIGDADAAEKALPYLTIFTAA